MHSGGLVIQIHETGRNTSYRSLHLGSFLNIVSEKAVLRRLIKVNEEVENACYMEKEGTQMILEEAEKKLFNVLQRRSSDEFVPIQQAFSTSSFTLISLRRTAFSLTILA